MVVVVAVGVDVVVICAEVVVEGKDVVEIVEDVEEVVIVVVVVSGLAPHGHKRE